jgi:hypothetical protein
MLLVRPFHSRHLTHGGSTYRDRFYGQRELVIRPWPWVWRSSAWRCSGPELEA